MAYERQLEETTVAIAKRPEIWTDRLGGPVGLYDWKHYSVWFTFDKDGRGTIVDKELVFQDGGYKSRVGTITSSLPDSYEILFRTKFAKVYNPGNTKVHIILAAEPKHENAAATEYHTLKGSQFNIRFGHSLERFYRRDGYSAPRYGYSAPIPLPGFANGREDILRICKMNETVTIRCNDVWIATDVSPSLSTRGTLMVQNTAARASWEASIFIPTTRCYDNDRIRGLMENAIDRGNAFSTRERYDLVAQAAALTLPDSYIRKQVKWLREHHVVNFPDPNIQDDAPALESLTVKEVTSRYAERGESLWVLQDPHNDDAVWRARPNGVLDVMSRIRYWTDTYEYIPDFAGSDAIVSAPVFTQTHVWFPTDRGLFSYDRRGRVFKRTPVAGVFHAAPVEKVVALGKMLIVTLKGEVAGGTWTYNVESNSWTPASRASKSRPIPAVPKQAGSRAKVKKRRSKASSLLRLAKNFQANGSTTRATEIIQRLLKDYPDAQEADEARRLAQEWTAKK